MITLWSYVGSVLLSIEQKGLMTCDRKLRKNIIVQKKIHTWNVRHKWINAIRSIRITKRKKESNFFNIYKGCIRFLLHTYISLKCLHNLFKKKPRTRSLLDICKLVRRTAGVVCDIWKKKVLKKNSFSFICYSLN